MIDPKQLSVDEKRKLAKELLLRKSAGERPRAADTPVAVIGIGCRFPGGIVDPQSFWRLLDGGVDAIGKVPRQRWDAEALYDPDPDAPGKSNAREGGFVDAVDQFDASFFGLSPREAIYIDPQQRLLLETTWEALERAGIPPHSLAGSHSGVFVGIMWHDYKTLHSPSLDALTGPVNLGTLASVASGRISYLLGLHGPSVTVDTACSSSLVSIHLACQSLRTGECELALAGGSSLLLTPILAVEFAKLHGLAPDGRCKSFSAAANGVGWSDGCGMVVLKRLDDALRAGDPIWGVLRGSAVNQDGRSNGLTAPNGPAQEAVLRRALASAGVAPEEVDYVEAHATGTTLGDPIEAQALAAVYGATRGADQKLRIGSVKSNFGHTMAAAGVAGLIKVLLAMRHERLPASLHASTLSPHVPWDAVPMRVLQAAEEWRANARARIAGISSFGISGTNAHLIVSEPPVTAQAAASVKATCWPILLSGQSTAALAAQAQQLATHLDTHPEVHVVDVAHTLARRRTHFDERAVLIGADRSALARELRAFAAPPMRQERLEQVAFLCTGQGAQYSGMGRGLYQASAAFRDVIKECARTLDGHLEQNLLDVLFSDAVELHQTHLTQPALYAMGVALDAMWRSWGVRPQLLLGHSVGEYVAAHIAGVFSLADGARLLAARGRLMQSLCVPGAMLAVELDEAAATKLVEPRQASMSLAAINGPQQVVLSGDETEVTALGAELARGGIRSRRLPVSHAFHSPLMRPMLERFAEIAATVRYAPPRIPIVSNVTGALATDMACADYWVRHVLAPVRFADGMRTLYDAGARGFVELGPQPTLLGMGAACLPAGAKASWHPSLRKGQDDLTVALRSASSLWSLGVEVDFTLATEGGQRIELPTYPFQRQRFWIDMQPQPRAQAAPGGHPLVGTPLASAGVLAACESMLGFETLPWLRDHLVFGQAVLPGAALVEWVLAAADLLLDQEYLLGELVLERALVVPEGQPLRAQLVLTKGDTDQGPAVAIYTHAGGRMAEWTRHATGRLVPAPAALSPQLPAARGAALTPSAIYTSFGEAGLHYGPAFQAVRAAWRQESGAIVAELALPPQTAAEAASYRLHPALFDAALHSLALTEGAALRGELFLPFAFHDVRIVASAAHAARVEAVCVERNAEAIHAAVTVWDAQGACIASVGRLLCKRVSAAELRPRSAATELLYTVAWQALQAPAFDDNALAGRAFLLVTPAELPPLGQALADRLRLAGSRVTACGLDELPQALAGTDAVLYFACLPGEGAVAAKAQAVAALQLAQAVVAHTSSAPRLVWVSERAQALDEQQAVAPWSTAGWGLARVLLLEQPAWPIAIVDVDSFDDRDAAERLLAEIMAQDAESQVSLRRGQRHGARLVRPARAQQPTPIWQLDGGAVLITGGFGGMGLTLARHLVQVHGVRRLVLLGRRGAEGAAQATIEELRQLGATVSCVQADMTDRAALSRALADAAPVRAVAHAAGVGGATLLGHESTEHMLSLLAAKVEGGWLLHELTRELPLAEFVLFSSVSSLFPDAGVGAYALANAFLDGLAQHRRALGLPAHSLNLGPWAGPGMFAQVPAGERERMLREGLLPIDPEPGLAAIDQALRLDQAQTVVAELALQRRQRLYQDATTPSLWRQLIRGGRAAPQKEPVTVAESLDGSTAAERETQLESLVQEALRRALSLPAEAPIPRERPFVDLGVDSLIAIELRNRLGNAFGIQLSATLLWEHRTVRSLAAYLAGRIPAGAAAARSAAPAKPRRSQAQQALRLHPEPPAAPLFAIGGVLGGATYFQDLANELGPMQPFYTMPYPGLDDDEEPMSSVDELAEYFTGLLQRVRPHGPYALAGHSFGGLVAFEMARRLVDSGEGVLEVILFDTWTKATVTKKKIIQTLQLEEMLAPFIAAGHMPGDMETYKRRFARIWQANTQALERYQMRRFDGDVSLIVPEDDLFGLSPNVEDWRHYCASLRVRRTSGNHATMVLPPNARRTAHILRGLLRGPTYGVEPVQPSNPAEGSKAAPDEQPRREATDAPMPLPRAQRWMWLLQQLNKQSIQYNLALRLFVEGELDLGLLDRALALLQDRHEVLRMSFVEVDGEPRALFQPGARLAATRHDLSSLAEPARTEGFDAIKSEVGQTAFDLTAAPMARIAAVRLGPAEHCLCFGFHHIVFDGASSITFALELVACYRALLRGGKPALPVLSCRLADIARWERAERSLARIDSQTAYWRRVLHDLPMLKLPLDRPQSTRSGQGGLVRVVLDARLIAELKALAGAEQCSLNMVLLATYAALLGRYSGQEDFAIATVVANRTRPEMRQLLGCFINTVLVRLDLKGNPTVSEHFARVRTTMLEAMENADLQFDEVVRIAAPASAPRSAPFAQACYVFTKLPTIDPDDDGPSWRADLDTTSADVIGTAKFDLTLSMAEVAGDLIGDFVYASDVFDAATIERMSRHLVSLLRGLVEARGPARLADLPLLTRDERHQLLVQWNDTARVRTGTPRLHELFEEQAARTPERTALVHDASSLTYRELLARVTALAAHLHALGVQREDCVGLCVERSIEMVIGLLAILKAGGAYVPLDPAYPQSRLRFMLDDSGARVVLVSAQSAAALGAPAGLQLIDVRRPELWSDAGAPATAQTSPRDLAYLIYTSGSTGIPKAVEIEHASAVELVRWALAVYPAEVLDGVLAATSICFDLSIFELFVPLAAGGRVVLVRDALELARLSAAADVRLVNTVPSAAAELLRLGGIPATVRVINLAGEPLPQSQVEALYAQTQVERIYDLYGPSEDTTYSTYALRERGGVATIGRPISNTRVYILDSAQQPVPVGVAGEICIAGAGLARGYRRRPELTAERFIPDPFVANARMYRTGDRGRFHADGNIEFLGRLDGQIKLRGFRIELGEIEAALRAHPGIGDCAVAVRTSALGEARLCAYLVGREGTTPPVSSLRAHLSRTLPQHMLPQHFVALPALPRNQNGKLDRNALPVPDGARAEDGSYVPPEPGVEQTIAAVWREALGCERVGRDDHFFELGGHSLLATQVARRLGVLLQREVAAIALFEQPVLRELATLLGASVGPREPDEAQRAALSQKQAIKQVGKWLKR